MLVWTRETLEELMSVVRCTLDIAQLPGPESHGLSCCSGMGSPLSAHCRQRQEYVFLTAPMACVMALDALTHGGVCRTVMVGWLSPSVCIADTLAMELCLFLVCYAFVQSHAWG